MAEKEVKKTSASDAPKKQKTTKATAKKTVNKPSDSKAKKTTVKSSDFAVVATGGKQYVVRNGDLLKVEKIDGADKRKPGDKLTFNRVLLKDDGKDTTVGTPIIKGAKVEAELIADGRDKKLHVIRFRAKSRHFRKVGHRQPYTLVKITKV